MTRISARTCNAPSTTTRPRSSSSMRSPMAELNVERRPQEVYIGLIEVAAASSRTRYRKSDRARHSRHRLRRRQACVPERVARQHQCLSPVPPPRIRPGGRHRNQVPDGGRAAATSPRTEPDRLPPIYVMDQNSSRVRMVATKGSGWSSIGWCPASASSTNGPAAAAGTNLVGHRRWHQAVLTPQIPYPAGNSGEDILQDLLVCRRFFSRSPPKISGSNFQTHPPVGLARRTARRYGVR